jgi:hypothetical protein
VPMSQLIDVRFFYENVYITDYIYCIFPN